jgi:hypothetical protein
MMTTGRSEEMGPEEDGGMAAGWDGEEVIGCRAVDARAHWKTKSDHRVRLRCGYSRQSDVLAALAWPTGTVVRFV